MLSGMHNRTKKSAGFTLAELLIVVAIIAALVAVSIPIFSTQLEKSREATDLANIRGAYAEVMVAAVGEDKNSDLYDSTEDAYKETVYLKQKKDGWESDEDKLNIGGVLHTDSAHWKGDARANGYCTVTFSNLTKEVTLIWSGYTVIPNYQWQEINGHLTLSTKSLVGGWDASAIPEFISAKNNSGQKLVVGKVTGEYPTLKNYIENSGGYEIGIYFVDKNDNVLWEPVVGSGVSLSTTGDLEFDISTTKIPDGDDVKIAIQFFKMKPGRAGSITMPEADARELERLISVQKTTTP